MLFATSYDRGDAQVVWTTLVADLETPVSAFLKIAGGKPMSFLLESVEGGAVRGRYSIIGLEPDLIFRVNGKRAEINRAARQTADAFAPCEHPPLQALRELIAESRIELPEELPPMAAGVFGYLGYDMVRQMEELPAPNPDPLGLPDAIMMRPTIDHRVRCGEGYDHGGDAGASERRRIGERRLRARRRSGFRAWSMRSTSRSTNPRRISIPARLTVAQTSNTTRGRISRDGVAREGIHRRRRHLPGRAVAALRSAVFDCRRSRSIARCGGSIRRRFFTFSISAASPSPDRARKFWCASRDGRITIRPIAGTRPRGATPHEDVALEHELLADPKERAEHLMLLDLGRNDVGRVAKIGSVNVTDQFFIERYSQVMHIVSNVEGELADNRDALDALAAGFPAGTVSGAPKVRAMEIIDELEKEKRGIYAGCVGYFSAAGDMDTCIVLRTALVKDGKMYVQAGAGIVADSDPASEQTECVNKAKALFRAAEEARRFAASAGRGQ